MSRELQFNIESLEDRSMMAGNVSVSVNNGDLRIEGDNADNQLVISGTGEAGQFRIVGGDGTTINGQSEIVVTEVNDDVRIDMGGGNDRVGLAGIAIADDVNVRMGDGNDQFLMVEVQIGGGARIMTGDGDDRVGMFDSPVAGRLQVSTGDGDDTIALDDMRMDGRTRINSGDDNDQILFAGGVFEDRVSLRAGSDNDMIFFSNFASSYRLNGGSGLDRVNEDAPGNRSIEQVDLTTASWGYDDNTVAGTLETYVHLN